MDFLELAKKRHSVRKYADKPVEEDKLQQILQAGRAAPTAVNFQPQRIIVVREKAGLDKLKKTAQVYDAPLAIIVCADHSVAWKRPFDGKNTVDIDASIVTDHMMLQATELGLGSVWICYFKPDILKEEFNIPDQVEPVNILAVGYVAGEALAPDRHDTLRKPLKDTVCFETYHL